MEGVVLFYTTDHYAILCRMLVPHPKTQPHSFFFFQDFVNRVRYSMNLLSGGVTLSVTELVVRNAVICFEILFDSAEKTFFI